MSSSLTNDVPGVASSSEGGRLGAATRLGPVHLTVTDLERSVSFYERIVGLRARDRVVGSGEDEGGARVAALGLGDGDDVLVLHEDPAARAPGRESGLYHVALLYPSRVELARAGLRVAASSVPIDGASDHETHEAIYLPDPDGIGLELAADRPRSEWPDMSDPATYAGGPQPLDQRGLFGLVAGEEPSVPAGDGLSVGHLHLHVGDVETGLAFYRDLLGFDLVTRMPSAAFVSAGGYHHHVAFNTWRGEGVPAAPAAGVVGLREWTLLVDGAGELEAVRGRLERAGVEVVGAADGASDAGSGGSDGASGFVVRDPFGMAVRVRVG